MAAADPVPQAAIGWRRFAHPRVLAMLFLGFSAGLPFPLVFATLSAWLATAGVSKATIGMFAWVGMTYSLKPLWAPLVDHLGLPLLDRWLGRRRSWMLVAQVGLMAALFLMSGAEPGAALATIALLAVAVAFSSATQDIVVDAWRIEAVRPELQGVMAAAYQFGYRIAMLVSGGGALVIAGTWSWPVAYRVMALLTLVGMITVLAIDEPASRRTAPGAAAPRLAAVERLGLWLATAFVGPFAEFLRRNGPWALVLLAFIACYRISDLILGVMANPFYLDIGFSLEQIGFIVKGFGLGMTLLGAALGGIVVARFGPVRPLIVGAVLGAATNLVFAWLALQAPELRWLMLTISADNLAAGFAGTVFIAYLSSLTSVSYTATQYALFSSLMTLLGNFIAGFSGRVVEASDWVSFFWYSAAMGLPAIVLSLLVIARARRA